MITITEVGAKRVTGFLENRGKGLGLRVKIRTTGCSGYAYVLEFDADHVPKPSSVPGFVATPALV